MVTCTNLANASEFHCIGEHLEKPCHREFLRAAEMRTTSSWSAFDK